MLVLATALWSVSFPAMKALGLAQQSLVPESSSWFFAALCIGLRFGVAAVAMAVWCLPTWRRLSRLEVSEGIGLGVFSCAGLVLQMDGLAYTSASTSAFLTQCYCLIIPVWLALWHRHWPSPTVMAGCAMVVVGVAVLSEVDWRTLRLGRGEIETLLASVAFTGQILWLQRPKFAANNVNHFSLVMFATIAVCALPVAWLTARQPMDLAQAYSTPATWSLLAVLVVFCTLGGCLLMNYWQPDVTATQAGLIYCAEPVFVCVVALFLPGWLSAWAGLDYPNETLHASLLLGGGLITAANILVLFAPPETAPGARPAADATPLPSPGRWDRLPTPEA